MTMNTLNQVQRASIREKVAEILGLDLEDLRDEAHFRDDYDADSLLAIEVAAFLESELGVKLPRTALSELTSLSAIYQMATRNILSRAG